MTGFAPVSNGKFYSVFNWQYLLTLPENLILFIMKSIVSKKYVMKI
ncbi:MAG: hypothetical protein IKI22_00040 [Neisseriaceae bacterium]|nr:hypothetical protein [Neisseriaceae bacterium]